MAVMTLTKTSMVAGVWQGALIGRFDAPPTLRVTHLNTDVPGIEVQPCEDGWSVRVPIPAHLISDGVQSFVISEAKTGATLTSFVIVAGDALAEDIRAEMDLLRAELDMLKRAFRRHCVETA